MARTLGHDYGKSERWKWEYDKPKAPLVRPAARKAAIDDSTNDDKDDV